MTKTRRIQFVSWGNNLIRYLLDKIPFDGAQIPNFGQLLMIKLKGSQKHQTTVHFCTGKSRFSFIYAENFGSLFWRGARQRIHWSNGGNKETHCSSTNWYKHRENNWDFFLLFCASISTFSGSYGVLRLLFLAILSCLFFVCDPILRGVFSLINLKS